MNRVTLFSTITGGILLLVGALILLSAVTGVGSSDTRGAGLLMMSFAGMIISIPLYIEARRHQSNRLETVIKKGKARSAAKCGGCGMDTAAFWCTTHLVRLCADCVPKHDEPTRCLYKSLVQIAAKAKGA